MPTLSRQTNAVLLQVVEQIAYGVLLSDRHGFIELQKDDITSVVVKVSSASSVLK